MSPIIVHSYYAVSCMTPVAQAFQFEANSVFQNISGTYPTESNTWAMSIYTNEPKLEPQNERYYTKGRIHKTVLTFILHKFNILNTQARHIEQYYEGFDSRNILVMAKNTYIYMAVVLHQTNSVPMS